MQIVLDLSYYYIPKIAPRSAASAVQSEMPAMASRVTMPPAKELHADREGEGKCSNTASLCCITAETSSNVLVMCVGNIACFYFRLWFVKLKTNAKPETWCIFRNINVPGQMPYCTLL